VSGVKAAPPTATGAAAVAAIAVREPVRRPGLVRGRSRRTLGLVALLLLLVLLCLLSLALGSRDVALGQTIDALLNYDPGNPDQAVIRELRIPRTAIGLAVGVGLGLAGVLMQGITRNPLADPGLLGITAGAFLAVTIASLTIDVSNTFALLWFAFIGAAVGAIFTYGVASLGRGGPTPIKLAIVGTTVSALFLALTTLLALRSVDAYNALLVWSAGSLTGSNLDSLNQAGVFVVAGVVLALTLGRPLNALALGEDVARAQGQRVGLTRALAGIGIVMLAGTATAMGGPIVFVGLVVPHVARAITGPDYRWILPYALMLAPILLLVADIVARLIMAPRELPVGLVTVMIGGPFFIALVRKRRIAEL